MDGKLGNTVIVDITNAPNHESVLFSLDVTVDSTIYNCVIDNINHAITLSVPTGTNLLGVSIDYIISENAILRYGGGDIFDPDNMSIYLEDDFSVLAENGVDYTDYTYNIVYY